MNTSTALCFYAKKNKEKKVGKITKDSSRGRLKACCWREEEKKKKREKW